MIREGLKFASIAVIAVLGLAIGTGGQVGTDASKSSEGDSSASSPARSVVYFPKEEVDANFQHHKGMDETLYAPDYGEHNYSVKTSRREKPLAAELHMTYTDVLYVVKGSATLITGGKLVDDITPATYPNGKPFSKDEKWGRSISGGESRHLSAGDVVIIPNGVPHWFSQIDSSFWFFNVKVR
jgi:mannose-6-phosphate isomerase-like protein (cupin superfamily)